MNASRLEIDGGLESLLPLLIVPKGADAEPLKPRYHEGAMQTSTATPDATGAVASSGAGASVAFDDHDDDDLHADIEGSAAASATSGRNASPRNATADKFAGREIQESLLCIDPDSRLGVSMDPIITHAQACRAACEALTVAVWAAPSMARQFAREDRMQALILPLLQTSVHPRLVAAVLKLCREVLPRCSLYAPALPRHAFFRAILLTGDASAASRQRN